MQSRAYRPLMSPGVVRVLAVTAALLLAGCTTTTTPEAEPAVPEVRIPAALEPEPSRLRNVPPGWTQAAWRLPADASWMFGGEGFVPGERRLVIHVKPLGYDGDVSTKVTVDLATGAVESGSREVYERAISVRGGSAHLRASDEPSTDAPCSGIGMEPCPGVELTYTDAEGSRVIDSGPGGMGAGVQPFDGGVVYQFVGAGDNGAWEGKLAAWKPGWAAPRILRDHAAPLVTFSGADGYLVGQLFGTRQLWFGGLEGPPLTHPPLPPAVQPTLTRWGLTILGSDPISSELTDVVAYRRIGSRLVPAGRIGSARATTIAMMVDPCHVVERHAGLKITDLCLAGSRRRDFAAPFGWGQNGALGFDVGDGRIVFPSLAPDGGRVLRVLDVLGRPILAP